MTGIGGQRVGDVPITADRHREGPQFVEPEPVLDALLEFLSYGKASRRTRRCAQLGFQQGNRPQCGHGVPLGLDHRDGRIEEVARAVDHRTRRVFPALVHEVGGIALVGQQPVPDLEPVLDPPDRGPSRWQQLLQPRRVTPPIPQLTEQHAEQWSRIDCAVIPAPPGHLQAVFAEPGLVEDLAGFFGGDRVRLVTLQTRQQLGRLQRCPVAQKHGLNGGDDAVATKQRDKPRDPGGVGTTAVE